MSAIQLKAVKIDSSESQDTVVAEQDVKILFTFDRAVGENEKISVRINLWDPIFHLEYNIDSDITRFSFQKETLPANATGEMIAANEKKGFVMVQFPEELSGGDFIATFYLKPDASSLGEFIDYSALMRQTTLTITSKEGQADIDEVYLAFDDNIRSPQKRDESDIVHKNETVFVHILTHGMYGKELKTRYQYQTSAGAIAPKYIPPGIVRVRDNVCCFKYEVWHRIATLGNITDLDSVRFDFSKEGGTVHSVTAKIELESDKANLPVTPPPTSTAGPDARLEPLTNGNGDCRIEFRPNDYKGNFGFSWYRKGELGQFPAIYPVKSNSYPAHSGLPVTPNLASNDHSFDAIMGRHYLEGTDSGGNRVEYIVPNGNDASPNFRTDANMSEQHKMDYRKLSLSKFSVPYYVPVMTLQKGEKAVLRLFGHTLKEVSQIYFQFDNNRAVTEGYFDYKVVKLTSVSVTNSETETYTEIAPSNDVRLLTGDKLPVNSRLEPTEYGIEITCLKEFSAEVRLNVFSLPKQELKLEIKDGVVVVTPEKPELFILPPLAGAVRILPNDASKQRKIKVAFFNVITNMNGEPRGGYRSGDKDKHDALKKYLGQAYVYPDIEEDEIDLTNDSEFLELCKTIPNPDPSSATSTITVIDGGESGEVEKYLRNKIGDDYDFHYKIFFYGERCSQTKDSGEEQGLNGWSSGSRERFTLNFASAKEETPAHELLHALGMAHTFDGSSSASKYVYEDGKTDNIMDYSHLVHVARRSLFEWQWRAINIKLS